MVRRIFLITLCLCLFAGCDRRTSDTPPITSGFTCAFSGTCRGMETAGTLTRAGAGLLTLSLTAPPELAGLDMTWDGERVTVTLLGLSVDLSPDTVPEAALGAGLLAALDSLQTGGEGALDDRGRLVTPGGGGDGAFTLYSDPATGALLALSVPGRELELSFSEFTVYGN